MACVRIIVTKPQTIMCDIAIGSSKLALQDEIFLLFMRPSRLVFRYSLGSGLCSAGSFPSGWKSSLEVISFPDLLWTRSVIEIIYEAIMDQKVCTSRKLIQNGT